MLICKNCGETAPVGTLTCPACRMAGWLRPSHTPAPMPTPTPDDDARHCRNCAATLPTGAEKCPRCQMPLRPASSSSAHTRFDIVHFLN